MKTNKKFSSGLITGIMLPMGLICLFAFCSLALALMGGRAYKQIQAGLNDSFGSTVAASYLRTKISQNNRVNAISLQQQEGLEYLVINTEISGKTYETRIFVWEGQLMEVFVMEGTPFTTNGAIAIAAVQSCDFSINESNLFEAVIETPSGTQTRTAFALLQGGEA